MTSPAYATLLYTHSGRKPVLCERCNQEIILGICRQNAAWLTATSAMGHATLPFCISRSECLILHPVAQF